MNNFKYIDKSNTIIVNNRDSFNRIKNNFIESKPHDKKIVNEALKKLEVKR
ncbi:hypothetical protein [Fructilactobacillus carniphilus]|uniref:Uncharacterized protein n=1 Tax=Fructilactobacillus carniphilus TaxID=2940297 RepID=A0ABY5BWG9_9LACO|nr:hypothetical protein [Fructilactobacillus carniphilus]USS90832.1 hypothetical protein M3M37_00980 [Fructilactobacillus carniphilus]